MQEGPTFGLSPEVGTPTPTEDKKEEVEVTILDVAFVASLEPERLGKQDAVITYQLPDGRTLQLVVPAEEIITPEGEVDWKKVEELITKQLEARRKLVGRKIKIRI